MRLFSRQRFASRWVLAVILALCSAPGATQEKEADHSLHQKVAPSIESEQIGGVLSGIVPNFELINRTGKTVDQTQFLGKYVLVGFGFTHCGHICPTQAANMAAAIKSATVPVAGVFISVDTERDTPVVTDDYASKFGGGMVGLSGSHEQVAQAAKNFQVTYAVTKSPARYTVQHSSSIYLLDPEGDLLDVFPFNTAPDDLARAIDLPGS